MMRKKTVITLSFIVMLCLLHPADVHATDTSGRLETGTGSSKPVDVSETYTSSEGMTWYVRGIEGKLTGAGAYAGTDPIDISEFGRLGDSGGPAPKTLLLVDNSSSVRTSSKNNVSNIKAILTRIIWNHQPRERFALVTFGKEAETLVDYTDNYDELRLAVEKIEFKDKESYLRNVLYEQMLKLSGDGEDDYSRIILISDGSENSKLGVTYEELTGLLSSEEHRLPVYTVGMKYRPFIGELDKLFALSRMTDTPYYLMEDYEEVTDIADGICADGQEISFFRMDFPAFLRTGENRTITLAASTDSSQYNLIHSMSLPIASIEELEEMNSAREEQQRQEAEEKEKLIEELEKTKEALATLQKQQEEQERKLEAVDDKQTSFSSAADMENDTEASEAVWSEKKENILITILRRYGLFLISNLILAIIVIVIVIRNRKPRNISEFKELEEAAPEDAPVVQDPDAKVKNRVLLINIDQPDMQYPVNVGETVILGRSRARSDISFPEDRAMAGRQARLYFEFGKACIESLDSDGTTTVNGTVIRGVSELTDGSELDLAGTRLRIQYE